MDYDVKFVDADELPPHEHWMLHASEGMLTLYLSRALRDMSDDELIVASKAMFAGVRRLLDTEDPPPAHEPPTTG